MTALAVLLIAIFIGGWLAFEKKSGTPPSEAPNSTSSRKSLSQGTPETGNASADEPSTTAPSSDSADASRLWKKVTLTAKDAAVAATNGGWFKPGHVLFNAAGYRFKDGAVRFSDRWEKDGAIAVSVRRMEGSIAVGYTGAQLWSQGELDLFEKGEGSRGSSITRFADRWTAPLPPPGSEGILEVATIGAKAMARLNGQLVSIPLSGDLGAGGFGIFNGYDDHPVAVKDAEFINLDGLPNAEAILGWSDSPPIKTKFSSPAAATKTHPFVNTLGMKFVPVPITGGPTDQKRVLFSVWETRVHDYEVFLKETKQVNAPTSVR